MKSMGDRWRQKVENNRILEEQAKEKQLKYCYFDKRKAGPTRGPFPSQELQWSARKLIASDQPVL